MAVRDEPATAAPQRVAIPLLVGVTGKRKEKLDALGVSEAQVRERLGLALDLLEALTPNSPKLLLCGMADGVDEIAARLVIETLDAQSRQRKYGGWSVVGLLPLPEEAFLDDFPNSDGRGWWYHELDAARRSLVRVMPLETLRKTASADTLADESYTADELRQHSGEENPARTAHYEQLALVLAERSTVLLAVMPEDETPDKLGGAAQVVAHRLNGWRSDWPTTAVASIAAASDEFILPPPLATSASGDVWLIPIGRPDHKTEPVELRLLRGRRESEPIWPDPLPGARASPVHRIAGYAAHPAQTLRQRLGSRGDILIQNGMAFVRRAAARSRTVRALEAFNHRAAEYSREPPPWDDSIRANPAAPQKWSPVAVADRFRGTLSDVQITRKKSIRRTAAWLGGLAWVAVVLLEIYLELHVRHDESIHYIFLLPTLYVAAMGAITWLLWLARRGAWAAVSEDYRMVAEALRVQMVWWQCGLIERRNWVDQRVLRYDTGEFQLLRQSLATLLNAIKLCHAPLPAVEPGARLPHGVGVWIGELTPDRSGQIGYQYKTAHARKRAYDLFELFVWTCFGIALGVAIWLAIHVLIEALQMQTLNRMAADPWSRFTRLLALGLVGVAAFLLWRVTRERFEDAAKGMAFRRVWQSMWAALAATAAGILAWHLRQGEPNVLHQILGTTVLLTLATGGAIKYISEKIGIEAEAHGAAEASVIYVRARHALDAVDGDLAQGLIDLPEAHRRRQRIVLDLGQYALTETESWLRSHRERPLHPPIGS
jgi:hypothetical protein